MQAKEVHADERRRLFSFRGRRGRRFRMRGYRPQGRSCMGTMKENAEWKGGDSQITVMVEPSGGRQFVGR
jgi:hypothetical protein